MNREWATLVVFKYKGGRAVIVNGSERGLFSSGDRYYNHQLRGYPDGAKLNVVVRLSDTGRRMVQRIDQKEI